MASAADDDDDGGDKPLDPSEKRINDALDKGNLPVAREGPIVAMVAASLLVSVLMLPAGTTSFAASLSGLIAQAEDIPIGGREDALTLLMHLTRTVGVLLVPVLVLLVAAGLAVASIPRRPRLVADRLVPKLSHISPMSGFQRIYGAKGMMEFAKSLGKIAIVGTSLWIVLVAADDAPERLMRVDPADALGIIHGLANGVLVTVLIAAAALYGADLVWSNAQWIKDLRMSHQDMKDELKDSDGDPFLKAKRQQLQRERAARPLAKTVPAATVVITNPTHFAVALKYESDGLGVPEVVAKGQDEVAQKIKALAREHDVPMVENVTLARGLYRSVKVGDVIPPDFYAAVAEIIHMLIQANARRAELDSSLSPTASSGQGRGRILR